jgi:uncharacterized membrane protein YeaQ/YmgE (transglycosylase-associated protein family)
MGVGSLFIAGAVCDTLIHLNSVDLRSRLIYDGILVGIIGAAVVVYNARVYRRFSPAETR